jgi:hypothetical protein
MFLLTSHLILTMFTPLRIYDTYEIDHDCSVTHNPFWTPMDFALFANEGNTPGYSASFLSRYFLLKVLCLFQGN